MFYWTKTLVTCIAAGIVGAYAGTYMTMNRVKQEQKEISNLIEKHHPDKVHIIDVNDDWKTDVILQKGNKIEVYLCDFYGSLNKANSPDLEKKVREQLLR